MRLPCARFLHCLLFAILAFSLCGRAGAAPLPPWTSDLQHTSWTRQDGAPSAVYSLTQDASGMLWFAATDGLYSFDGARFVRTDEVFGHKLRSPLTMAVAADGDAIWVSYQFGDISRFERGAVHHYVGEDSPPTTVFRFARTPDGVMWASSGTGMHRLEGERWREVGPSAGLPNGRPHGFSVLTDGSLLVYCADAIYRGAPGSAAGERRFVKVLDQPQLGSGYPRPDGKVVIKTRERGLRLFDPASGATAPLALHNGGAPLLGYEGDARGGLWVATGDAVQLLDGGGKLVRQFSTAAGFTDGIFNATLHDREGNLWFTTANGVDRVRQARLQTVALPPGFVPALSVTPGDGGAVWIGNSDRSGAFDFASFVLAPDGSRRSTAIMDVSASHRAPDGALWFGNDASLWRVRDGTSRRWPLPAGLTGRNVQAMTTGAGGALWVSVIGHGVHTFRDGAWHKGGGRAALAGPTAVTLATDRQGRTWFGYTDNHIAILDGETLRHYGPQQGLAVGNALAIVPGRAGAWIGGDRGLAWFDGERFVTLDERGGRGFRGVSGIVERADGELWLHDTGGLARVKAADLAQALESPGAGVAAERFDHLDGHRGMPAQMQPLPSLVQTGDGRLWFATSSIVGHIDPARIPRNPRPPTVMVTAIRTDQGSHAPAAGLVLPARTTRLEIDFTATALSMPERVRFRYRLTGQDLDWRETSGPRQAVYTNLAPGDYLFEVVAANEDGVWSPQPARAALRIDAAWTQTLWFRLACALALLAAAWLLHRWRLARLAARLREKMLVRTRERERIARTLHDTFLQSVQALVLRMHVLMGRLPADSGMRAEVEDVLGRAEYVIEEGRQQVRQLRVPGMRHGSLARALADAGRELAAASGVTFVERQAGRELALDPEIEDELFTIGREALSNAFHHARASQVTLALDYRAGKLRLAVSDDGEGIAPEILASGARQDHWGLPGMREAARLAGGVLEIDSTAAGTVVSICIPVTTAYQGMRRA
ncbi:triple tyrosine motif-containing protein [Massilia sp. CFBP9012]|uniref:sensor histidine kinase n=1 Tax=Massilia sp. CFBP9012 TaxID=3096531 RepID=UPI002A6A7922|nr:triple tyrosine motif-containing protein [Massilia sp. CFBP9012]MDY0973607.1 triple tyrosine motif-containing protein [Massilia sp. CFBP9012]